MYLYNLTLQSTTGITQAIVGNFSAPKAQEIVLSKGNILELLQIDLTRYFLFQKIYFNIEYL